MTNGNSNGKNGNGHAKIFSPKKFLFVEHFALNGDLAWKIKKEGHLVKCWAKEITDEYDGFVEKVGGHWKDHTDWADVVVFNDTGFGKEADALRKTGKAVIGGSAYTDRLEMDREFGQTEMKRLGLLTLPTWEFDDYDKALDFIKENPGRYVFKPSGKITYEWEGFLVIGKDEDGKDLYEILKYNKEILAKNIRRCILQKHVSGVEVGASAFFNGEKFITPILVAFEHKRLFPGEIGPMTGEMGTSMFWSEPNVLFAETTGKIEEELKKAKYVGYIDINCIVNGRGIYPLEFTCRFGYPTINIQQEGILSDWGDFFYAISNHQDFNLRAKRGFQIGVVVVTPPFPYEDKWETKMHKDISILFRKPNTEGVHIYDAKIVDGVWRTAGDSGYHLVVTASGTTMEEARKLAYARVENIVLVNMIYRTDIGASWSEDSDRLRSWGYLDQVQWPSVKPERAQRDSLSVTVAPQEQKTQNVL